MGDSDRELITSLKDTIRRMEMSTGDIRSREPRYEPVPTRLEDGIFPDTVSTPYGEVPVFTHSMGTVTSCQGIPGELAVIWGIPSGDIGTVVSLDIETSGPLGGSGGLPFVIGLADNRHGIIRLEQIILRTPDDEMAALWHLEQTIRRAEVLLTYNGTRFDLPLLRKRYETYGTPWNETYLGHCRSIDLEKIVRSINILPDEGGTLMHLERHILSLLRPLWSWHDIWRSGIEFDTSRRRKVARILAKNGYDCMTLFHLLNTVIEMVEVPRRSIDTLGSFLGRELRSRDPDRSFEWYMRAASVSTASRYAVRAALEAWSISSEEEKRGILIPALLRGMAAHVPGAWKAAERLGLYEWRRGNVSEAEKWTDISLQLHPPRSSRLRLQHRLRRYRRNHANRRSTS